MIELAIHDLTKYYEANLIFENISFDIKTGQRIGLIGPNGCGKTTLSRIILGETDYQAGALSFKKGITIGYLDQMPNFDAETTALDVLHMAFKDLYALSREMKSFEQSFHTLSGQGLEKALATYGKLTDQYELLGGYTIETEIGKIRTGLSIDDRLAHMPFEALSGGEKTRIILGKILLEAPDLLLLDEPSNHLDLDAIEWLETYLEQYPGTALIISHDRYFLDRVVTKIVEMTPTKAIEYHGNYGYYVVEKERRFLIDMKFYLNQQKKLQQMERQIQRYRIWGEMRDSDKMFRKAKELEKRLEKMEKVDRPVIENKRMKLAPDDQKRSGKRVLELTDLSKSFEDKHLLEAVQLEVFYQDSLAILGPNGSGKSTLLKIILDEFKADTGSIHWGSGLHIGYLPQNVTFEDESLALVDYISAYHDITLSEARHLLAKVLFVGDDVFKKIMQLSGGEKSRLKLCSLLQEKVNCMVLDEPTNHLDIDSREVLEDVLSEFNGTILFVSHDRYFISKLATKIAEIQSHTLKTYPWDYNGYKAEKAKEAQQSALIEAAKQSPVKKKPTPNLEHEKEKQQQAANRALKTLEDEIASLESQLEIIATKMVKETLNYEQLSALYQEKEGLETKLSEALDRWAGMASE